MRDDKPSNATAAGAALGKYASDSADGLKRAKGDLVDFAKKNEIILHLQSNHFVLFSGMKNDQIALYDPDRESVNVASSELKSMWKGNCLIIGSEPIVRPVPENHSKLVWWILGMIVCICFGLILVGWRKKNRDRYRSFVLQTRKLLAKSQFSINGECSMDAQERETRKDFAVRLETHVDHPVDGQQREDDVGDEKKRTRLKLFVMHQRPPSLACRRAASSCRG